MQVEAKLTIADEASFQRLGEGFVRRLGQPTKVVRQRNVFLDASDGCLASVNAVCRIRTDCIGDQTPTTGRSTVVLKLHNEVEDGSSARFVIEADMPSGAAYRNDLRAVEAAVAQTSVGEAIRERFGNIELRGVGSFENTRTEWAWPLRNDAPPLNVHLDRTQYPFGEGFEVEVSCNGSVCIDEVLEGLQNVIQELGIPSDRVALGGNSKFQTYAAGMSRMTTAAASHMRVEAKVLLPNEAAYERLLARLIGCHIRTDTQRNLFFDTARQELSSAGAYLRLRMVGTDKFTVTIKEHSDVREGSGLSWVQEEEIPSDVAEALVDQNDLSPMLQLRTSTVAAALVQRFGVPMQAPVIPIGSFTTRRSRFHWPEANVIQPGLERRVDETTFEGPSGTAVRYEVEVADISAPVHDVLDLLCASLRRLGIEPRHCETTKFQEMVQRAQ